MEDGYGSVAALGASGCSQYNSYQYMVIWHKFCDKELISKLYVLFYSVDLENLL